MEKGSLNLMNTIYGTMSWWLWLLLLGGCFLVLIGLGLCVVCQRMLMVSGRDSLYEFSKAILVDIFDLLDKIHLKTESIVRYKQHSMLVQMATNQFHIQSFVAMHLQT